MISYNREYNVKIREICSKYKNYQVVLRSKKFSYLLNYIFGCTDEVFENVEGKEKLGRRINFVLNELQDFPKCKNPNCNNKVYARTDLKWNDKWPESCSSSCSAKDPIRIARIANTKQDKYGDSKYNGDKEEIKRKNRELYGSDWFFSSEIGKKKVKEAWLKNGYDHPMHSEKIKREMSDRYMEKHGVPYSILNPDVIKKAKLPYFYDGIYFKSSWELAYYMYLKDNGADFEYQPNSFFEYHDDEDKKHYYFPDFKVDGEYVEIKGGQFYANDGKFKNPYDSSHETDGIYENKRKCMEENGIKVISDEGIKEYLDYCTNKFNDVKWHYQFKVNENEINSIERSENLDLEMDVGNMMKEFEYFKTKEVDRLPTGCGSNNVIVKYFQQDTFFKKEKELWKDETVKNELIENRCRFLKKTKEQLTANDMLMGFKRSGFYYGYSHFNPFWFKWFIKEYNVRTCYDPCGGWGHRLLGGLNLDKYIYNDFSKSTKENVDRIIDFFKVENAVTYNEDCRNFMPNEYFESMFTCVPYFNVEHYECGGFKDISEYESFMDSIFDVFHGKKECRTFGLVIREDLLPKKHSNFAHSFRVTKENKNYLSSNTRTKCEYLYVFVK